ncbi:glycosyltransferase family 2 protein [Schumannella soli]|uniref:glycosyltransferase family 2 protein n=1 Tax=Schumannella soli TaxID=2590779 RepID=UPI002107C333|nr:glycosyltransferase family 2 protein [Schumannella soli]
MVVTFNRRAKLETVLDSLAAQSTPPEWIVVVDNASTDGTGEYLAGEKDRRGLELVSLDTNTGGAGGFSTGMKHAYDLGAEFVWIMDDDCYPGPDALEKLVSGFDSAVGELGGDVPFSCSVVKFIDGSLCEMNNPTPTWDWGRLLVKGQQNVMVRTCSFVSVLIPRWAIEKHGLPYRDYFIWFDDHEYTLRLSAVCPGVQVLDSVVVHDMGDNKGVNFGGITEANAWKFAYGVRNEASYRLHHEGFASYLIFAARVTLLMRRGRVASKLRWRMTKKLLRGITFNPKIERVA